MALNRFIVNANIYDIKVDAPNDNNVFLVDSNVWYWLTYTNATQASKPPLNYQVSDYPNYINKVLNAKAKLYCCCLSFAELAHSIESTEFDIHKRYNPNANIDRKKYRRSPERKYVIKEIEVAWEQINNLANFLDITLDKKTTDNALSQISNGFLDSYDAFLIEVMNNNNIKNLITDDADFASIKDICIFTANEKVLTEAKKVSPTNHRVICH